MRKSILYLSGVTLPPCSVKVQPDTIGTVRYGTVCNVGRQVFGKQQARGEVKSSEGRRQHSMLLAASTETQRITDQQLDGDPVLRRRWKLDWHSKRKERDRQR